MRFALTLVVTLVLSGCQNNSKDQGTSCLVDPPTTVSIEAANFRMGADRSYPEEGPARMVSVGDFNIDRTEVTNSQFAQFVKETGYVTDAEKLQPGFGKAGAAVFMVPDETNPNWWRFIEGAHWRKPEGDGSSIKGRGNDPVVQVSIKDAKAYAEWAGRRLPTQEEWEYAARAGSDTRFVWGEERDPDGKQMANTWQGAFPVENTQLDGHSLRAPVGCFSANGFGLYDMIGNVWEWTDSLYNETSKNDTGDPLYTIKGGSFLCADNFCRRYTGTSRQAQEATFSTNHIGFRTVKSE